VVDRAQGGPLPAGLTLLMRQGMAMWMSTWADGGASETPLATTDSFLELHQRDLGPLHIEMVRVLAAIVMSNVQGVT